MGVKFRTSNSFFSNGGSFNIQTGVRSVCTHNQNGLKVQIGIAFPNVKSILEKRFTFFNHCSKSYSLDWAFTVISRNKGCQYFEMIDIIFKRVQLSFLSCNDRYCWCSLKIHYNNRHSMEYLEKSDDEYEYDSDDEYNFH